MTVQSGLDTVQKFSNAAENFLASLKDRWNSLATRASQARAAQERFNTDMQAAVEVAGIEDVARNYQAELDRTARFRFKAGPFKFRID